MAMGWRRDAARTAAEAFAAEPSAASSVTSCGGSGHALGICYAMLCYAMLCYAMPCHAVLCHATLCHATLCNAMPCYAMLRYAMPCHAMLWQEGLRRQRARRRRACAVCSGQRRVSHRSSSPHRRAHGAMLGAVGDYGAWLRHGAMLGGAPVRLVGVVPRRAWPRRTRETWCHARKVLGGATGRHEGGGVPKGAREHPAGEAAPGGGAVRPPSSALGARVALGAERLLIPAILEKVCIPVIFEKVLMAAILKRSSCVPY